MPPSDLPAKNDLKLAYAFSLAVALLMARTSILGIACSATVYPTDETLLFSVPTDIVSLVVVLPALLGSMWLARRGKLSGLLCWPGGLLYVIHIYLVYVIGIPFGPLYPLHLVLVALSTYTLISLIASIDAASVRQRLAGMVADRVAGAILMVLSVLFVAIQVPEVISPIASRRRMAGLDIAPFVGDMIVLLPAWIVGGCLLWRRSPLGYVGGAALMLVGTTLFVGLGFVLILSALSGSAAVDWVGVVMMLTMGLVCGVPFALFLRGASSPRSEPAWEAPEARAPLCPGGRLMFLVTTLPHPNSRYLVSQRLAHPRRRAWNGPRTSLLVAPLRGECAGSIWLDWEARPRIAASSSRYS